MESKAMTEEEEFEFRLRYEREQEDQTSKAGLAAEEVSSQVDQPEQKRKNYYYSEGLGKGLRDPLDAAAQMLYNAAPESVRKSGDKLNNWIAEKTGLLEPIPEGGFNEQLRQQEEAYQGQRVAEGDTGVDIDRIGGNVVSTAVPGMAAARAAAPATAAGRIAMGAGTGAGYGLLTPTQEKSFWPTKAKQAGVGAMFGGAIPAATSVAGKGMDALYGSRQWPLTFGTERNANKFVREQAGPEREKIIAGLQEAREIVPGNRPTAGQAIAQAAKPGDDFGGQFIRMERDLAKAPVSGSKLKNIYAQQGAGREKVINAIAGTDDALGAAKQAREASSLQNYGAAYRQKPKITQKVTQSVEPKPTGLVSPSGKPLMGKATTKTVTKIESELRDLLSEPYIKKALPTANNLAKTNNITLKSNPTKYMHYVKIGLDKQLQKTGDDALTNAEKRAVQKVKTKMVDWMGKKNNLYEVARATYAKQSVPINRMQVGQELKKSLINPAEQERATTFLNAMTNAPRTMKRATGFNRYDKLGDVLTTQQTKSVKEISDELINQARAKTSATGTESILSELPGAITLSLPRVLSRPVVITNHVIRMIGKDKSPEYKAMLTDIMSDPKSLEKALQLPSESAKARMAKDIARELAIFSSVKAEQQ